MSVGCFEACKRRPSRPRPLEIWSASSRCTSRHREGFCAAVKGNRAAQGLRPPPSRRRRRRGGRYQHQAQQRERRTATATLEDRSMFATVQRWCSLLQCFLFSLLF